jgi:hypothetical protein
MKGQQAGADVKSRNRALVRILALPWMFGLFHEETMMSRGRDFTMDSFATRLFMTMSSGDCGS